MSTFFSGLAGQTSKPIITSVSGIRASFRPCGNMKTELELFIKKQYILQKYRKLFLSFTYVFNFGN